MRKRNARKMAIKTRPSLIPIAMTVYAYEGINFQDIRHAENAYGDQKREVDKHEENDEASHYLVMTKIVVPVDVESLNDKDDDNRLKLIIIRNKTSNA